MQRRGLVNDGVGWAKGGAPRRKKTDIIAALVLGTTAEEQCCILKRASAPGPPLAEELAHQAWLLAFGSILQSMGSSFTESSAIAT